MMLNKTMKFILILLFIFTPTAFGSMEIWAFSLMELGILLLIILWSVQNIVRSSEFACLPRPRSGPGPARQGVWSLKFEILFICLFLILVIFQLIPLPSWVVKILSPKTYELHHALASDIVQSLPAGQAGEISIPHYTISFVPFLTKIEFYKWLTLIAFFLFLLHWKFFQDEFRITNQLILVVFLTGVFESLYGTFEFFSGHQQILYLKGVTAVTGTFVNRNYFAGYLLMVIPLGMAFFFSRQALHATRFKGWRQRLSSLEGRTLLIGFGIIVMILGLIFSASRMGILSLLLSFTLISILFKNPRKGKGYSKSSLLILGLALLWALWIGLDAVISPFFNVSEDFKWRWTVWEDTLKMVKDFSIFGSGLGTFSQIFPMYKSFHMRRLVTHPENDFLQLSSEVGLIGIGILFVLFIFLFVKAVSGLRCMSPTDSRRYFGIGGLVGILALMFHSLVERNLQVPANAFLFTFIWALILRIGSFKQSEKVMAGETR